jgi:hypothetical protein
LVELQRRAAAGWTTVAKAALDAGANAKFEAPVSGGTARMRIAMSVNQAGVGYLGASSHAFAYHKRFVSLAVPQLKVLFGKSLTLSGEISTRTSEQAISIRAGKYGHSELTKIGTVMTGKYGHWSFRIRPTIQTIYVARWMSTNSHKLVIGVEPLATLHMLADGRIATHIAASRSLTGRQIQLQQLKPGQGGWQTIEKMPLNSHSSAIFTALSASRHPTLRVAMSVNEAGVGFLGSTSHPFIYQH